MDEIRFEGRVAVITGAGRGLGRAYALALAGRGARVVVNDKDEECATQVVREIQEAGGEAAADGSDLRTREGGRGLIQTALGVFGKVEIVVNNAGILRDKSFVKMDPGDWQSVLDVHLGGAFHVTQAALANMRDHGYGRIVMTVSSAGLYGNFGQSNYAAAKMGLFGLMNVIRQEVKKYDIKVNAICPTALTRMTEGLFPPELAALSKPDHVAPMLLLLASEQCPETGQIFRAGLGHYARVALVTGQGIAFDDNEPVTPERLLANLVEISSLERGVELDNTTFSLKHALQALGKDFDSLMRPGKK